MAGTERRVSAVRGNGTGDREKTGWRCDLEWAGAEVTTNIRTISPHLLEREREMRTN